ncbi:hypothetical protein DAERI_020055 [Deinococcus aerius]|uniref:Uncharacterized protein n=2 Tax=Deinococcus TaxID=1298 RepID=A0A2I9DEQ6_9DEIO|nr:MULTISPECIES: hypothetical protein [Deinococcus]MBB5293662.1 hypothetical protein [Deinococcus metallilatus]QBY07362.1 hypothetical protein E5F05_05140 [Deinococcus metallilatus]RXJ14835.1 hypothetical protein ERJ73_03860 [Deinococcus metallilatus]TLK30956.1 hypothetical protein FCS05_04175 [Deinococcus metallilatus]GBF04458.1 hypothetical protein DAERI_020055 [Deinococcus aerius]
MKHADLQLEQDLAFQYRSWTWQRLGWVVMALLVVAAFLGLFGDGPLSEGQRTAGGEVTLAYQRFARVENQSPLRLVVQVPGREVKITLSRDYADDVQVQTVTPQPDAMTSSPDGLSLTFQPERPGPLPITLFVEPERPGVGRGKLSVDGAQVVFRQWIWP